MFLLNFTLRLWTSHIRECYFRSVSLEIMFSLRKLSDKFTEYFEPLWTRILARILETSFLIRTDLYKPFWGFIVNRKYGLYSMDKIAFTHHSSASDPLSQEKDLMTWNKEYLSRVFYIFAKLHPSYMMSGNISVLRDVYHSYSNGHEILSKNFLLDTTSITLLKWPLRIYLRYFFKVLYFAIPKDFLNTLLFDVDLSVAFFLREFSKIKPTLLE